MKNNAAYALTVISPRLQRPPSQSHLPRTSPGQAHITIKNNKTLIMVTHYKEALPPCITDTIVLKRHA